MKICNFAVTAIIASALVLTGCVGVPPSIQLSSVDLDSPYANPRETVTVEVSSRGWWQDDTWDLIYEEAIRGCQLKGFRTIQGRSILKGCLKVRVHLTPAQKKCRTETYVSEYGTLATRETDCQTTPAHTSERCNSIGYLFKCQ